MPNIKYQIFVSSTYADLVEERQGVSRAILDLGHIPAGMEMFPAADVEQLIYIKKVIDECDYYLLILGARYGSLDEEGVSFTEREYDYAVESGKTVLAFVHADMDDVSRGKTDKDEQKYIKLLEFKEKVTSGRLVMFWRNGAELVSQTILSLIKSFSVSPQIGWVRADAIPAEATLTDVLKFREENERLKAQLEALERNIAPKFDDAVGIEEPLKLSYDYYSESGQKRSKVFELTFVEFLRLAAPGLHTPSTLYGVSTEVKKGLQNRYSASSRTSSLNQSEVQDTLLHLVATGHVKMWPSTTKDGTSNVTGYQLTEVGTKVWQEMSYIKRDSNPG